jgi:NACHT domain
MSESSNSIALDVHKLTAEIVVTAIERSISTVAGPAQTALRRLLHELGNAYQPYLDQTFYRVRTFRTFLNTNEPIDLLDSYVSPTLSDGKTTLYPEIIINNLEKYNRTVISGLAGRGKSILLKYIAVSLYHAPKGFFPIFIELRSLNSLSSPDVLQYIHATYKGSSTILFDDFNEAMHKGYFVFLFDGFDEVDPEIRPDIENQILAISVKYYKCPIIITSRPDERFSAWDSFSNIQILPMSYENTISLIDSSKYDPIVTKIFLKRLTPEFYSRHESFLSTPLLAIMMMITFEEYAEIPDSLHVFYRHCFETLVRRHDAMKAQFLRKTFSSCTAEQFRDIFSSFCLLTYLRSQYQFSHDEIINYIEKSLAHEMIKGDPEKVLNDLIESICLLQKEGFEISFVHRSFQEYFCALYISQAKAGLVSTYLDNKKLRLRDNVIPLLYGMVPDRVESEWASAVVNMLVGEFKKSDGLSGMNFLKEIIGNIEFMVFRRDEVHVATGEGTIFREVEILKRLYPAHFYPSKQREKLNSAAARKKRNAEILNVMEKLEADGDKLFTGVGRARGLPPGRQNDGVRTFRVEISEQYVDLISATGLIEIVDQWLVALREIQKDQTAREAREDDFLVAVGLG